jgi:hypothetical protein
MMCTWTVHYVWTESPSFDPLNMLRLEVRDLRLVAAIFELGNLTRAGQHLHLTQSALSHQLADLEQRVVGMLFVLSGRRILPK